MGVLTDFFRATPEELRAAFTGWKEPLQTPVRRSGVNPFTKKPIEIVSWDPAPEREVHERGPVGPPSPSIDLKGLDFVELQMLCDVLLGDGHEARGLLDRPPLIGPNDAPWVHELPAALVAQLAAVDAQRLGVEAQRWAELRRRDISSIRDEGARATMLRSHETERFVYALQMLATFARETVAEGRRMYMWTCL